MRNPSCARIAWAVALMVILVGDVHGRERSKEAKVDAPSRSQAGADLWLQSEQVGSSVLFYVEVSEIGEEFLIWRRYPSVPLASRDHQLVRWQMDGNSIALEVLETFKRSNAPLEGGKRVIARFDILRTHGSKKVIDVSSLFRSSELSQWELADLDADSASKQLEYVASYRDNTVVVLGKTSEVTTGQIAWNFVKLPRSRMPVRFHDRRFGFDYPARRFYSSTTRESGEPVTRWRLERPAGDERVSSPIVVKVDPRTPKAWRQSVLEGISSWDKVFRRAGFKNAIVGVDPGDGKDFSFDDLRNSVICWKTPAPMPRNSGACGWMIYDPRTGEQLQFQIGGPSSAASSYLGRYISTLAAVDTQVSSSASISRKIQAHVKRIAAHEVGHVIGLRDGNFGKYQYTAKQVRSPGWVAKHGFSPSIMNYARFNFLAQPEDQMPSELLVQDVGPADVYSLLWGYSDSPEAVFDPITLAKAGLTPPQDTPRKLLFVFTEPRGNTSPADTFETVEVTDPIEAANLGLSNLRSSMRLLASKKLVHRDAEIQALVGPENLFRSALEQWAYIVTPVATMVGGRVTRPGQKASDDESVGIPTEDQLRALRFLCDQVFSDEPTRLFTNGLKDLAGTTDGQLSEALVAHQTAILHVLFQPGRLTNFTLAEFGAIGGKPDVGFVEAFSSLRSCPFSSEMRRQLALQASTQPPT